MVSTLFARDVDRETAGEAVAEAGAEVVVAGAGAAEAGFGSVEFANGATLRFDDLRSGGMGGMTGTASAACVVVGVVVDGGSGVISRFFCTRVSMELRRFLSLLDLLDLELFLLRFVLAPPPPKL